MSTSTAPQVAAERWTIVTHDGRAMFREDLFTEAEARAYVVDNPTTPNGTPQVAVPESIALAAGRRWRTIRERHDQAATAEARIMLLSLLDVAGVAPTFAAQLSVSVKRARRVAAGREGVDRAV